jgi:hypothetical protein
MPRRRHNSRDGIAVASSCTSCAGEISTPPEYAPGRHMALIHAHHMPELVARGWIVTTYPHEPPDVVCPHYAALCADGDGDGG